MANLRIVSFEVLDADKMPLPRIEGMDTFRAAFRPQGAPTRFTGKLYLALTCGVSNALTQPIQGFFRLMIQNADEYIFFEYGNGDLAKYFKQLSDGDTVFLPFRLSNRKLINTISNAQLSVQARDSATQSTPGRPRFFQIEPA